MRDITRRRALTLAVLGSSAIAGCSSSADSTRKATETATGTAEESETATGTGRPTASEESTESATPPGASLSPSAALGESIPGRRTFFGGSVALSSDGSTALVGARDDERDGETTGAAYVFGRGNDRWERRGTLLAEDAEGVTASARPSRCRPTARWR